MVRPLTANGASADGGDAIEGYLARNGGVEDIPIAAVPVPLAPATANNECPPMDPKELERLTLPTLDGRTILGENAPGLFLIVCRFHLFASEEGTNHFYYRCE